MSIPAQGAVGAETMTAGSKAVSARTLAGMLRSRIERAAEHKSETVSLGQFFADQIHRYLTEAGHGPEHDARSGDVPADGGDPDCDCGRDWGVRARQVHLEALSKRAAGGKWFASTNGADGLARLDNGTDGMFPVRGEWHEIEFVEALVNAYRNGDLATPAQPAGGVPDSLRALSEAASEDWDTNEATPYILGPPIDGDIDRFEVIARGPHGYAKNGDDIRKWQANRMFAVAAVKHVRTLPASHPAGQSTDDTPRCGICDKPLIAGQRVMQDVELNTVHAACCGPEREAYVKDVDTGEPLGPNDPIPQGYVYEPDHPAGQSVGSGAVAQALRQADWSGVSIGNKALISAAINELEKPAPDSTRTGQGEETVAVPASALRWLFGDGPDADGVWFGDQIRGKGAFWWRSEFRRRIEAARPAAPEMGCLGPASAPSTKEG